MGKNGMVTTRDLIKCGRRKPQSPIEVACQAFKLIGEKLRSPQEQNVVEGIISSVCGVELNVSALYQESAALAELQERLRGDSLDVTGVRGIGVTGQFTRMWTLLNDALRVGEPVLLVGETSTGKTTACQLYAASKHQK